MNATQGSKTEHLLILSEQFPLRDDHGRLLGFYVYDPLTGERLSGPFGTRKEALEFAENKVLSVVCGHVFTAKGHMVQENAEGIRTV